MRWMITGTSSGFGRALALAARDAGHEVTATARNLDDIADLDGIEHLKLDLAEPPPLQDQEPQRHMWWCQPSQLRTS